MTNNKMTNAKALNYVKANFAEMPQDVAERIDAMIASYERKAENKKPTKAQEISEELKAVFKDTLAAAGKGMTVTELIAAADLAAVEEKLGDVVTNQRASAVLAKLVKAEEVVKTMDKKKVYFSIA